MYKYQDFDSFLLLKENGGTKVLELANYKFCGNRAVVLDNGLEKMESLPHAGRNLQWTLYPMLTLTIASVRKEMLM